MRALLGVLLLTAAGCSDLWSNYIGTYMGSTDGGPDGSPGACGAGAPCDLAGADLTNLPPADMTGGPPACTNNATCTPYAQWPVCDLNTGYCAPSVSMVPYPPAMETAFSLANPYQLMVTADFDGDGHIDVAVSGVFENAPNPSTAGMVPVEIYRGNGSGGFIKASETCSITGQSPVALLPISAGAQTDLFVATTSTSLYRCVRAAGGTWTPKPVTLSGSAVYTGFKQLALANDEGGNLDLVMRTSTKLFTNGGTANGQGQTSYFRAVNPISYTAFNMPEDISSSNTTWITPIRVGGTNNGDSMAVIWDDFSGTHPGVDFQYLAAAGGISDNGYGMTMGADVGGYTGFTAFGAANSNTPFAATAVLHNGGQVALLHAYSLSTQNTFTILYGANAGTFAVVPSTTNTLAYSNTLMYPYCGDANTDGVDEVFLYTAAYSGTPTNNLLMYSYKQTPLKQLQIIQPTLAGASFRGMALAFLGGHNMPNRKDLIALQQTSGQAQLMIWTANLNAKIP